MPKPMPYTFTGRKAFQVILPSVLSVILIAIVISCGSGTDTTAGGGTGGTGKHTGTITAFGSVFVNAIEFETTDASITVDDASAGETSLRIGMKVQLEAVNGRALYIVFEPEVKGPVTAIDAVNGILTVLGQNIVVGGDTAFDGIISIQDLQIGDNIEVSGFSDSAGNIIASYIGREDPGLQIYKVIGTVSNHYLPDSTFTINSLEVDYSHVFNPPVIDNGETVHIKGTMQSNIFIASELYVASSFASPGEEYEIEGLITLVTSPDDFYVNGQRVRTNAGTEYEHGSPSDIAVNRRVEVEGTVDSNGILIASEVEFHTF